MVSAIEVHGKREEINDDVKDYVDGTVVRVAVACAQLSKDPVAVRNAPFVLLRCLLPLPASVTASLEKKVGALW